MKYFILALSALLLCITVIVLSRGYILSCTGELLGILDDIRTLVPFTENSPDEVIGRIEYMKSFWSSRQSILCIILSHKEYDEIEDSIGALLASAITHDRGNFSVFSTELHDRLTRLAKSEKLTIYGIL